MEEIEPLFNSAAIYLGNITDKLQAGDLLYFYARYKQANEGPCNVPKPGFFDFQGKQKWDAWNKLGKLSKEDAMNEYITKLTDIEPQWEDKINDGSVKKVSGLGTAVSTMANTDNDIPDNEKTLFDWVKEGCADHVQEIVAKDQDTVNKTDEEGMAPLHWACDRGNLEITQILLKNSADPNIQDADGQTSLHYATCCDHLEVAKLLLKNGADCTICDNDGCKPECDSQEMTDLLNQYR